ncbi:unnamed protein product [Vitrella brassicaformis CCMP3155]|uniref:Uncharacterized protein n=1 Tax=Vitrella brassicaformis (strain CCMP3155) TaxID=1169540 RepID=A0A0G4F2D2_VITBC|nr:unnamed protein product [Vitrella brassicaformis CCMP3155]|eukprot:CEM05703.1 unnamed protein product [Vitrella brassicaformis CCMP3155]
MLWATFLLHRRAPGETSPGGALPCVEWLAAAWRQRSAPRCSLIKKASVRLNDDFFCWLPSLVLDRFLRRHRTP